ncbi:MAG: tryptophan-rich sensory protein [Microcystaceae cyanobacterium]
MLSSLKKFQPWINLAAIIAAFVVNILANITPINNLSIGEISDQYFPNVLIIPASYAFAIWGLIYLGLISLGVYGVLPKNKDNLCVKKIGFLLALSSLIQIVWVILFQFYFFTLSVLTMIGILIPLLILYQRLDINYVSLKASDRWFIYYPISLYLGWISVATIINIASTLDYINWQGWGLSPLIWTGIMLSVASCLATFMKIQRSDRIYTGVVIWALAAIAVKHWQQNGVAWISLGWAIALIIVTLLPNFKAKN